MESLIPELYFGIDFSKVKNIYLAQKPADLRKGIDGCASLLQGCLALDPLDGSLFLFVNRQKNKLKGILCDGNGYWLVYKRLARSSLQWPVTSEESDFMKIDYSQLTSLLSGMTIVPQPAFLPRTYKYV